MTTSTIFGAASDGVLRCSDSTYATAAAGGGDFTGYPDTTATDSGVGQLLSGGNYFVLQLFFEFDTTIVPDSDVVSAAVLSLDGTTNNSTTDFVMTAVGYNWSSGGLTTADWRTPTQLSALTSLATFNSSGYSASYMDFTSAAAAFNAYINKTGSTYFAVVSDRNISGTAPTVAENISVRMSDATGTTEDPKLVLTHATGISTYASAASNSTSWAAFSGVTVAVGELLVFIVSSDGAPTLSTASAGWNKLGQDSNGAVVTGAVFWKVAAATTESFTLDSTATEQYSGILHRITGVSAITGTSANGSGTNSNPPSHNSGAVQDAVWIATRSGDAQVVATVEPASYTGLTTIAAAGAGGASTNSALRNLTATQTEDPGTFTSATEQWVSWTLACYAATADVTVALTGQSLTAARGSVTGSNALPVTGQSLVAARGTVLQGSSISGQSLAAAQGSATTSVSVALTGLAISAAAGSITEQTAKALTGQAGVVGQGTIAPANSLALTGAALVASRGSVTFASNDVAVALTGLSLVAARGSLIAAPAFALSGQGLVAARGTIAPAASVPASGQVATVAGGAVVAANALPLSGQSISAARGTVSAGADVTAVLTGQGLVAAPGTTAASTATALAGLAAVTARGSVSPGLDKAVTGQGTAISLGTLASAVSVPVSGQSASVARGTTTAATALLLAGQSLTVGRGTVSAGSDVTVALTGQSLSSALGSFAPALSLGITGQTASTATGSLSGSTSRALSGQAVAAATGLTLPALSAGVSGIALAISQGTVTREVADVTVALTGQAVSAATGSVLVGAAQALAGLAVSAQQGTASNENTAGLTGLYLAASGGVLTTIGGILPRVPTVSRPGGAVATSRPPQTSTARLRQISTGRR